MTRSVELKIGVLSIDAGDESAAALQALVSAALERLAVRLGHASWPKHTSDISLPELTLRRDSFGSSEALAERLFAMLVTHGARA